MSSPDPDDVAAYGELLSKVTVGSPERLSEPIRVCDYDARWPEAFEREATRVRGALGAAVMRLEHVGSTSRWALSRAICTGAT